MYHSEFTQPSTDAIGGPLFAMLAGAPKLSGAVADLVRTPEPDTPDISFAHTRAELIGLLGKMQGLVREASSGTTGFTASLGHFGDQLGRCGSLAEMQEQIGCLVREARRTWASLQQLDGDLADSGDEIHRLSAALARMREEAYTDALTGLRNRRALDLELKRLTREGGAAAQPISMLIIDIDHFKRFNDLRGHLFGDRVLQSVAQAIADQVSDAQLAARFGGEEFTVLLPDSDRHSACMLAESIRIAVAGVVLGRVGDAPTLRGVTVSVGVAQRAAGESVDDWFERADRALYRAKHGGRNRVEIGDCPALAG